MKNNIYIRILVIFAALMTSCEEKLDIDQEEGINLEEALSNSDQITNLLIGAYAKAGQAASYGGQITIIAELLANNDELGWNGTFTDPAEFNNKTISTTNQTVTDFWLNNYSVCNQVNIVLENLDLYEDMLQKNDIEGQAKFLRAVSYFDLIRFFGIESNGDLDSNKAGVPIIREAVTSYDMIKFPKRNTIKDVYNFIITDLEDAIELLPLFNSEFATKNAAKAILARVMLQIGNYERARDLASEIITSGIYRLEDYTFQAYNNENNSDEDIFAWQVTQTDGAHDLNTFWATEDRGGRPGNPDISIEEPFFGIFDDVWDSRSYLLYEDESTGSGIATEKWAYGLANIPFVRLAEMYLIRAESNVILGTTVGDTPLNDVNVIRERAEAFLLNDIRLEDVILERLRELSFEGHKLHDLKRLKRSIGDIPYNSPKLILPIPQREINVNPNLTQNNGY